MSTLAARASDAVREIRSQNEQKPLAILGLAEPLLPDSSPQGDGNVQSNKEVLDPRTLTSDLQHYRDLFSKLRFSYLEQVTKEKYLRSIVGDVPLPTAQDNATLEEALVGMKASLQQKKRDVEALVTEIEQLARDVAQRYDSVQLDVKTMEVLPEEIDRLESEVAELRQAADERGAVQSDHNNPRMELGLEETERMIEEGKRRNEELQRELEALEREVALEEAEKERSEKEVADLGQQRNEVTRMAREAQRLRESGGRDMLEEQGRWYQSSEKILKGILKE